MQYKKIFLVIFGLLLVGSSIPPSQAAEFGGIGGRPANPVTGNARSDSWFIFNTDPGAVLRDSLLVVNNTAETKTLKLYTADSQIASDGGFTCEQEIEKDDKSGQWISLAKSEVTLASQTSTVVPITVTVPQNADVGEHSACIAIQDKNQNPGTGGVGLSFRSAVRVYVNIPGDIIRNLEIVNFTVFPKPKSGTIEILKPEIKNTGNVSVDTKIDTFVRTFFWWRVYKNGGEYAITRDATSSWEYEFKKPHLGGLYIAGFTAKYDKDPSSTLGVDSGKQPVTLRSKLRWIWLFPTPLGLILWLLILALLYWLYDTWKRYIAWKKWTSKEWINYTVEAGDNINSIAREHNVPWKHLAKVNKLQPPFTLEAGDRIKVPPKHDE